MNALTDNVTEDKPSDIVARIIQAQIGSKDHHDLIVRHMEEYFTRWHTYKSKFTDLEWYHIFLDFIEMVDLHRNNQNKP